MGIITAIIGIGFLWWCFHSVRSRFRSNAVLPHFQGLSDNSRFRELISGMKGHARSLALITSVMDEAATNEDGEAFQDNVHNSKFISRLIDTKDAVHEILPAAQSIDILQKYRDISHCFILPIEEENQEIAMIRRSSSIEDQVFLYTRNFANESVQILSRRRDERKINSVFEIGFNNHYFWLFICPETLEWVNVLKPEPSSQKMVVERARMDAPFLENLEAIFGTFRTRNGKLELTSEVAVG